MTLYTKTMGILVVQYILGHAGFLSLTVSFLNCVRKSSLFQETESWKKLAADRGPQGHLDIRILPKPVVSGIP